MKTAIIRKAHFNAAHRLFNPAFSDEQNKEVFGLCSLPNYHGHNYHFEVKVVGYVNPETGYVLDTKILKEIIEQEIIEPFDHKNLNLDTVEFKNLNPTAENIVRVIYEKLRTKLDPALELFIRLAETERNIVEYPVF